MARPLANLRPLSPILAHQAVDPIEFAAIAGDDNERAAARVAGDPDFTAADRSPLPLQFLVSCQQPTAKASFGLARKVRAADTHAGREALKRYAAIDPASSRSNSPARGGGM